MRLALNRVKAQPTDNFTRMIICWTDILPWSNKSLDPPHMQDMGVSHKYGCGIEFVFSFLLLQSGKGTARQAEELSNLVSHFCFFRNILLFSSKALFSSV